VDDVVRIGIGMAMVLLLEFALAAWVEYATVRWGRRR